jgi:hypothetical protein
VICAWYCDFTPIYFNEKVGVGYDFDGLEIRIAQADFRVGAGAPVDAQGCGSLENGQVGLGVVNGDYPEANDEVASYSFLRGCTPAYTSQQKS